MKDLMDHGRVANSKTIKEEPGLFQHNGGEDKSGQMHLPEMTRQRPPIPNHIHGLAYFILQACFHAVERRAKRAGIKLPEIFEKMIATVGRLKFAELAPFVANLKGVASRIDKDKRVILLSLADIIWTTDGQHRLGGIRELYEWLNETLRTTHYRKNPFYNPDESDEVTEEELQVWQLVLQEFMRSEVQIQTNLDLDGYEERSSFHFLNNYQKPVNREIALSFDTSNPINEYSTELKERAELKDKSIKQQELVVINSILFLRRTNMKGARPNEILAKRPMADRFWKQVLAIPNVLESESVARPVIIKALASIAWDLNRTDQVNLNTLLKEIPGFDFSHQNPLWRFYELPPEERKRYGLTGLESYLPPHDPAIIRTVGIYKEETKGKKSSKNGGRMHWNIAHNTVYPLLADMIRWKLELPPRKHQVRTKTVKVED